MTRLYVNLGRRDNVRASEVTRLLRENVKLSRRDLGRIQVRENFCHIGVRAALADDVIRALHGQKYKEKDIVVEVARAKNADKPKPTQEATSAVESVLPVESAATDTLLLSAETSLQPMAEAVTAPESSSTEEVAIHTEQLSPVETMPETEVVSTPEVVSAPEVVSTPEVVSAPEATPIVETSSTIDAASVTNPTPTVEAASELVPAPETTPKEETSSPEAV